MLANFPTPLYSQGMNTGMGLKAFLDSPFGKQFLEESKRIESYRYMQLLLDDAAILKYMKETAQPTIDYTEDTARKRDHKTNNPAVNKEVTSVTAQIIAEIEADLKRFDAYVQQLFKHTDATLHSTRIDLNKLIAANDTLINDDQTINIDVLDRQQTQSRTLVGTLQQLLNSTISTKTRLTTYFEGVKRDGYDKLLPDSLWKNFGINLKGLDKRIHQINTQKDDLSAFMAKLNSLKPLSITPSLSQTFGKSSKEDGVTINNVHVPKEFMKP